jgi:hypothetical protein
MEKNFVCALTQQNATETTATALATPYTVPQSVSRLVEVGLQIEMAGVTTLEPVSAIFELSCDDATLGLGTQQFATDTVIPLTSGTIVFPARVHDINIPVTPSSHISCNVTFNRALTVQPSWRLFGKFA